MPVTVIIRSASTAQAPSLTFDGSRVVIGRSDGSDVRLPDPSVSLRHASIRSQGAEYAIVDEGSTNGTWVGGVKLHPQTPRLLKSGDLVRLGRVWLEIMVGQKAPTPDLGLATRDLALALVRNAMAAVGDDTVAKVRVVEGPDMTAELALVDEGRPYILGRSDKCDLPLADEDASREHASVIRRGGHVMICDMGSRNGVFLADTRIEPNRDVVWRPAVMARIGISVLALDEPVSLALAELESAPDERIAEQDAPPPPPSLVAPAAAAPPSAGAVASSAPASVAQPSAHQAPIAQPPATPDGMGARARTATTVTRKPRRVWTAADLVVVTIAIAIIGASVAGLVWVLR